MPWWFFQVGLEAVAVTQHCSVPPCLEDAFVGSSGTTTRGRWSMSTLSFVLWVGSLSNGKKWAQKRGSPKKKKWWWKKEKNTASASQKTKTLHFATKKATESVTHRKATRKTITLQLGHHSLHLCITKCRGQQHKYIDSLCCFRGGRGFLL